MPKIIILHPDETIVEETVTSYNTKETLQLMDQAKKHTGKMVLKPKKGRSKKTDDQAKMLFSLNVDNYQIQVLGWNHKVGDVNEQLNNFIMWNKKTRINNLIQSPYYDNLYIIKTTLSTKLLDLTSADYKHLMERLSGKNPKIKSLKLKAKYGLDTNINDNINDDNDDNDDDVKQNEENEDDEDMESNYGSSDDEYDDDEDSYEAKFDKKMKDIKKDIDGEDDDDDENDDNEDDKLTEDNDDDSYAEDDDSLDDDIEPDEDIAVIDINQLNTVEKKSARKGKAPSKTINLELFGDMLVLENLNKKTHKLSSFRQKCFDILAKLKVLQTSRGNVKVNDCRTVEQGVYNYCISMATKQDVIPRWDNPVFRSMYLNKIRSIYTNLSQSSYVNNVNFIEKVAKRQIDLYQIAFMKPDEIFPEQWQKLKEEEYRKNKLLYLTKEEAMTDEYKCRRCKKRETSYFELQIRSADEPATLFITCVNCGNRWTRNP